MLLETIEINPINQVDYPFNLGLYQKPLELSVNGPVTIFVGENGCGKSSLLKLIQSQLSLVKIKLPEDNENLPIGPSSVKLYPRLGKLKGFFFESIAFINYVAYVQREKANAQNEIERIDKEYKHKSAYSKMMAKTPFKRTMYELDNMYTRDFTKSSHGEAYLDFFASRIKDNQIYLLDEPETPLSIQNQLTLMVMIMEATKRGCQFIIATHSPILVAIPDALIYEIEENSFRKTDFENIKSIQLLKQFLNNKEQFLHHFTSTDTQD